MMDFDNGKLTLFYNGLVLNREPKGHLTHCDLVTPYIDIDKGQNWHR